MGIELPPELADVAAQTGVAWPEADEEAMTRQAQAWRDTATSMSTLATDADTTARSALASVSGETATKASTEWKSFVDPDDGHLTAIVRDANAAADRLEHAANQVGAAKVEIVRNLVGLAQNQDAAHAAAQAGHPFALAGLDTAVRGTAANVANIESQLVTAVQPGTSVDMATVQNPVNANPGHHLLSGVTMTATDTATQTVTNTAQTAATITTDTANQATHLPGTTTQGGQDLLRQGTSVGAGQPADLLHHVTGAADQVVSGTADIVRQTGDTVGGTVDQVAPGAGDLPRNVTGGAADVVHQGGQTVTNLPGDVGQALPGPVQPGGPLHPGDLVQGLPGEVPPGQPGGPLPGTPDIGPGDPEITGPVPPSHFPGDAPTPPTGQTVQAGFAGGLEASAAPAAPANLPPAAAAPPLNPGAPAYGGAPAFPGAPPVMGGAPAIGAPGAVPGAPAPGPAAPGAPASTAQPARPAAYAPAAPIAADRSQDPAPRKQLAGPPGAPPPAKGERNEVLAAFWIHMFPIGHLPVASYRPARQLPAPPPELDYAAGLRFEPADHPRFDLVDANPRLAEIQAAITQQKAANQNFAPPPGPGYPPAPPAHPAEAVAAGYSPGYADHPPEPAMPGYPPIPAPASPSQPAVGYPTPHPAEAAVPSYPAPASPNPANLPPVPASPANQPAAGYSAPHPAEADHPNGNPDADTVPNLRPVTPSAGLTADHPTVHTLLENHDPLGGGNERDWDRRYLVRLGSVTAHGISPEGLEYNWPTSEQFPEGGSATGEPEVLDEGTVIDRFGTPDGRVFAADGTPFAQRSLPPPHKDTGYRRYKVTKPLPVWRAVSAAWFGQPGGGVRYRTTHSAVELVALGYLEEIA